MKTCDPQRRNLLRFVAAGGVALCAPMTWGCKEKQETAGMGGKPPAAAGSAPPGGSGKVSQAVAQYQNTPKADQKCSKCMHFIADSNSCKLVEGRVTSEGWCKLFAAKAA
ncbi:MAG TPA: high-potential iron-sulfur protein [Burkholderiales bacterium]|nr:high-potential iron-sulfur protein [Burkholderiales bacterium]